MNTAILNINKLFKACQILFGSDIDLTPEFLYYIQPSGLKSAYRRRAMQTHPDLTANTNEQGAAEAKNKFIETNWAYESLTDFIKHRDHIPRWALPKRQGQKYSQRPQPRKRTRRYSESGPKQPTGHYYKGSIPQRKLLFGEYLFYGGYVPWEALIKAIVWQRKQRPRIGEMAVENGWMSKDKLQGLYQKREIGEKTAMTLVRLKWISFAQARFLLISQRKLQKPFGEFFVTNNYITRQKLNYELLKDFHIFNKDFSP